MTSMLQNLQLVRSRVECLQLAKSSACLSAAMPATSPSIPAYLESITKEAATCTLLTKDGGKVEVQAHLLSALSPLLACLLAQVGAIRSKTEFSVNAKNPSEEIACWASLSPSGILENLWIHFLQRFKSKKNAKICHTFFYIL